MMGDALALLQSGLGGTDVEALVDLHGVGVHDLAAKGFRELDGKAGLADSARRGIIWCKNLVIFQFGI